MLKCQYYLKQSAKFGTVAIKIPKIFPAEIGKLFLKFVRLSGDLQITKAILKKNKVGGLKHFLISKLNAKL